MVEKMLKEEKNTCEKKGIRADIEFFNRHLEEIKSSFLANISHELRTPLAIIYSMIYVMEDILRESKDEKDKKLLDYVCKIKKNTYRALRGVNNIIEVSNIDAGFISVNIEACNIVQIIEDLCILVSNYLKEHNIELIFDTQIEEKIALVDIEKIEKVILNVLSNAVKFSKQDSPLSILVNMYEEDDYICIAVKDNGIGIREDYKDKLFSKFSQQQNIMNRNAEGNGVGLFMSKTFMELQEGKIEYISELGQGSEFIIKIKSKCDDENIDSIHNKLYKTEMENIYMEFSDIL